MKISVVITSENAVPTAFAVLRGYRAGIAYAAELGFDGVELAVCDGRETPPARIQHLLDEYGMEVSSISTGQVSSVRKLWLSARDKQVREGAVNAFLEIIDMAGAFKCFVNMGNARGVVEQGDTRDETVRRFAESLCVLTEHARKQNVTLILEPLNRYESNFVNNVEEGAALLAELRTRGVEGLMLMPDVFHMNIEDASITDAFRMHKDIIRYIHVADSNRRALGWGHIDFPSIINVLNEIGYDGWLTAETLTYPTPEEAARQSALYLRKLIPKP